MQIVGRCRLVRVIGLPDYSEKTVDIEHDDSTMELCRSSKRKDFFMPEFGAGYCKVLEVAVGTDRVVSKFLGL